MISGYLITLLLIGEHERIGRVEPARLLRPPGPAAAAGAVHAAGRRSRSTPRCSAATRSGSCAATSSPPSPTCRTGTRSGSARGTPRPATSPRCGTCGAWPSRSSSTCVWPLVMIGLMRLGRRRLPELSQYLFLAAVLVTRRRRACSTTRARSRRARRRRTPTGRSPGAASRRPTRCTCRRRRGPPGCCSAPRSPWSGGRSRCVAAPIRGKGRLLDVAAVVGLLGLARAVLVPAHRHRGRRRSVAVPRRLLRHRPGDAARHRRRHPRPGARRRRARQPGAAVDRHPQLRPVPVPLADLPDDARGWPGAPLSVVQFVVAARSRRDRHRDLVPLHRDADPARAGRALVAAAAVGPRPGAAPADRRRPAPSSSRSRCSRRRTWRPPSSSRTRSTSRSTRPTGSTQDLGDLLDDDDDRRCRPTTGDDRRRPPTAASSRRARPTRAGVTTTDGRADRRRSPPTDHARRRPPTRSSPSATR